MKTLAIDIGGTKFSLGAFDDKRLVLRESLPTQRSAGPEGMLASMEKTIVQWRGGEGFKPDRCGIGFGGPVDYASQSVTLSTHVEGWAAFPLVKTIERIAEAPAVMDNDANVGALGEHAFGAGRGFTSLFYMTLSTGIGGGVIANDQLVRGADWYAGEIGHTTLIPDGPKCLCGAHGCFERMCCGLWLERDYGAPAHTLLLDASFVARYVVHLAQGLKTALMLLNPHRLVVGGGISKAGDRLFVPLREELNRQMTSWSRARRDVVPAALGDDSVLYGALALARTS